MDNIVLSLKMRSEVIDNFFEENTILLDEFNSMVETSEYENNVEEVIEKVIEEGLKNDIELSVEDKENVERVILSIIKFNIFKKIINFTRIRKEELFVSKMYSEFLMGEKALKEYFRQLKTESVIRKITLIVMNTPHRDKTDTKPLIPEKLILPQD